MTCAPPSGTPPSSPGLPVDEEWGEAGWDAASLDAALTAPPGDQDRKRLVGELLASHFRRYAQAVSGTATSFIELDKGLAEISRHARDVLGADAVVLLLDELVLWLSSYIGDPTRIKTEAQKVSKLVESANFERPAPIISFVPRQRDLRDLVGQDTAGATTASLFDTLKYWDGRFDLIKLADSNLPAIVSARLLRPKDEAAKAALDAAFGQAERSRPEVWEALLDAQGGAGSRAEFRADLPVQPRVSARHGGRVQCAAARADRAQADAAAAGGLPGCAPGRPAHPAGLDL